MSRKYKRKRLFPKKYGAGYVKISSGPDKDKLAEYFKRVQTTTGPKGDIEHKYQHTFNRPIIDGVVQQICCSCGAGPFTFQQDFDKHAYLAIHPKEKNKLASIEKHIPEYVPDERKHHVDIETGAYIAHALIETEHEVLDDQGDVKLEKTRLPKVIVNRRRFEIISSERRTKINELCYMKVGHYKLFFTPTKDRWFFEKELEDGKYVSRDFVTKEHALIAYNMFRLNWTKE